MNLPKSGMLRSLPLSESSTTTSSLINLVIAEVEAYPPHDLIEAVIIYRGEHLGKPPHRPGQVSQRAKHEA